MHLITQSCVLFLWMHSLTFVKGQECTLRQFLNSPLYDPNFDTSGLAATYNGGKQVRVGCNVGFSGFFKLICTEGNWESKGTRCNPKPCGHPGDSQNADFQLEKGEDFVFGSQVKYTCHKGYQMVSRTNYRRCMAEGWDGNIPVCEAQQCPIINVDNNVQVNGDIEEATFGNVVRFSCKSSSEVLSGSTEMYCDENGDWVGESPKCKEIICTAPEIENGDVLGQIQEYKENQVLEFQCKPSFRRAEARSSKCTKQGVRAEWSPTPLCEPITCKLQLPVLKGTSYEPAYRNTFPPGDQVTVTCEEKYLIFGHQSISVLTTCKEDGEWTIRPLCQEVTCSTQGVPHVSSWDSRWQQTFKSDETTRYWCETGYRRKGGASRATCTRYGWHPNPLCEEIICTAPEIENGDVLGQIQEYKENQVLEFQCKPSFRRAEARSSTCTERGVRAEWSPTPLCEPITCKLQLPGLKGTSYEPASRNTFLPGDQVTVNCGDKYWISRHQQASVVTTCKEDGDWTIRPLCQEVTCSTQGVPHVSLWDSRRQKIFKSGETTLYGCETGYRRKDGASSATCTRDGWQPNPLCEEKHCKKPHIDGANFIGVVRESYSPNDHIRYACKNNVEIIVTLTCEENGWNGIQSCSACSNVEVPHGFVVRNNDTLYYTCEAGYKLPTKGWWAEAKCNDSVPSELKPCIENTKCGDLPVIPNGEVTVARRGESAQVKCKEGYRSEVLRFSCRDGVPLKIICKPTAIPCSPPRKVQNAVVDAPYQKEYLSESEVTYKCRESYTAEGETTIRCSAGQWGETNIMCTPLAQQQ